MSEKFDVVAAIRYSVRGGEEKTKFIRCGMALQNDAGKISVKIDSLPVGPDWDGWLNLMVPRERDDNPQPGARKPIPRSNGNTKDFEDDVPF